MITVSKGVLTLISLNMQKYALIEYAEVCRKDASEIPENKETYKTSSRNGVFS